MPRYLADRAYDKIASVTSEFGTETHQQCKANKKHVKEMEEPAAALAVAGQDLEMGNLCKFCRSRPSLVHKFKLTEKENETAEGDLPTSVRN